MLKLYLDNGEAYPCFFSSSQVTDILVIIMSDHCYLQVYGQVSPVTGTRVEVCARLVSDDNSVSSE